jgi:TPR repeat protein
MAKLMKDQIRELIYKSSEEYLKLAEILEDDKDKFDCYLRAAELGNPQGQYKTGFYYWNGFGVEADRTKAIDWYIKAAQQEYREALYVLSHAINYSEVQDDAVESLAKSDNLKAQIVLADRRYNDGNYTESFLLV